MANLEAIPRVFSALPLAVPGASPDEALVHAIDARGSVLIQLAFCEARLRACSEQRPPSITIQAELAVEIFREGLRQLRPDLAALLDAAERRQFLRLVGDGPEAA